MLRNQKLKIFGFSGLAGLAIAFSPLLSCAAHAAPSSSIVVDANTGEVLQQSAPDAPRFPASVTKVMTLYLLFEDMERGRFNLSSPLKVSKFATQQAPSKLGVRAGDTISVREAILAIVTRSANDVAVVIAENIAGSQDAFATMMTQKARQIGMMNTFYKNASGLPDPRQKTTARDLALLGRALYERFPDNARYFSTRAFDYRGHMIGGHNRLLGRVRGVDGIKTGYTRASGFNLLTSARIDGRHVVAVVMGGSTGAQRDNQMAGLVMRYLPQASTHKIIDKQLMARIFNTRKDSVVASNDRRRKPIDTLGDQDQDNAEALSAPRSMPVALSAPPATRPKNKFVAMIQPAISATPDDRSSFKAEQIVPQQQAVPAMKWAVGAQARKADRDMPADMVTASLDTHQPLRDAVKQPAAGSGWAVQIAAASSQSEAMRMLGEAKSKLKNALSDTRTYTETVTVGSSTLYRARFAGFDEKEAAQNACKALKTAAYQCVTVRL